MHILFMCENRRCVFNGTLFLGCSDNLYLALKCLTRSKDCLAIWRSKTLHSPDCGDIFCSLNLVGLLLLWQLSVFVLESSLTPCFGCSFFKDGFSTFLSAKIAMYKSQVWKLKTWTPHNKYFYHGEIELSCFNNTSFRWDTCGCILNILLFHILWRRKETI